MQPRNRRTFIRHCCSLAGASACLTSSRLLKAQPAHADQPHFFLHVVYRGGLDQDHMFDPRDERFHAAGKVKNFATTPRQLLDWSANNRSIQVAPTLAALLPYRQLMTIVRGVHMSSGFNSHVQNANLLYTGYETGGAYYGATYSATSPLSAVRFSRFPLEITDLTVTNLTNSAQISADMVASISGAGALGTTSDLANRLAMASFSANAGSGSLSQGMTQLGRAYQASLGLESRFTNMELVPSDDSSTVVSDLYAIFQCYQSGISRSANLIIEPDSLDAHHWTQAAIAPSVHRKIADEMATIIATLHQTPFDQDRSYLDVTTVVISSEFGRTFLQPSHPIDATGTDHNTFNNTFILAGKGFRTGLVIGESDLDQLDDQGSFVGVSAAHRAKDAALISSFGKPHDVRTGELVTRNLAFYDPAAYINMGHIGNTVQRILGLDADWNIPGTRQVAPVISAIMA